MTRRFLVIALMSTGLAVAVGQQSNVSHDVGGMQMPGRDMSKMQHSDHDMTSDSEAGAHVMHSMEDRHMDMGPHMKMTSLHEMKRGDQQKADAIVATARKVAEKYTDYKTALNDGFKIFLPDVPQKHYHF